eukprot:CAMPEP_0197398086 /NCGR_PEP_ID=MMETSP1165-20131217/12678_1 /TAXON_ID=284809 /ORGANISM="Chrysocystis fragilis, Strain CCMP3189" /LENGTH=251 /DNA_ID=CAMNT_0042924025 /DNA_START=312 /DNA_END=1063 /DNA_ORIENTATION=-
MSSGGGEFEVGVVAEGEFDGFADLLDDGDVVGDLEVVLLDGPKALVEEVGLDDLRGLDLPEALPLERLEDEGAVGALLDGRFDGHAEDRGAVFARVGDDVVDGLRRDEGAGRVVDADERRVGGALGEAVAHRVLPLGARVREAQPGVLVPGEVAPVRLVEDHDDLRDPLQRQEELQAVHQHGLAVQAQELLRPVRLHARADPPGQEDHRDVRLARWGGAAPQPRRGRPRQGGALPGGGFPSDERHQEGGRD